MKKITVWKIITLVVGLIALGLIIASGFVDVPRLLTVGLAVLVLAELSSMHVQCLKKKENNA
ncbi:MAG: hypothetical protein J5379_05760 [Clostridiales bacterium]|nr:hypothetical protein [Clostridiales bacterium]